MAGLVILVVRLLRWRVAVVGLEHVPREGGAVIAWNHHSHVDFALVAWDVYRRLGRPIRFVAKREVVEAPLLGLAPRLVQVVPVDRSSDAGRDGALSDAVAALRAGHLVMVAPEGTISRSFELLTFRTGAARMAQLAGVPLIPAVSWGSHRLVTTGRRLSIRSAWRIAVTVRFGPPVPAEPGADPVAITAGLRDRMLDMLDDVQRTYPDGTPAGAWWVPRRLGGAAPPPDDEGVARAGRV